MPAKKTITIPPVIKVGGSKESLTQKKSSKSSAVNKTDKPVENPYQMLAKIEETIQELTRQLAESEDSKHFGVRGMPKLTAKQQMIKQQLEFANKRAEQLMMLMKK